MSPYPTAYQIEEMFSNRARPDKFHQYLADPIDVTVVGQDFHISGNYKSTQEFHDNIYVRIVAALKEESIRIEVRRVIGGGDSAWAAVETYVTAESKYDRPYVVELVDLVRFDSDGKIAQLKEFFDSEHIHSHLDEHDSKTKDKE
ncbi:MAG: hypothetical protein LQ342_001430 [Letrouitia transgressa]|nr:MAG: hypothetical protein LQ342_001430 [Letrouitia transgressa]